MTRGGEGGRGSIKSGQFTIIAVLPISPRGKGGGGGGNYSLTVNKLVSFNRKVYFELYQTTS